MSGPRSHLERLLRSDAFVVTTEMPTVDGADPSAVRRIAEGFRGRVDAVNCTDNSSAHPHLSSVAAGHLLLDAGVEPIVQLTCRDRNRLALQADLLGAAALGVRNVCLMTGDDVTAGDHPEAKPLYDLDSIHLIRTAKILRDEGVYLSGRRLEHRPEYLIGAVENPFAPPLDLRPMRLGKKIEAGAEFIQTQICFDLPRLSLFLARAADLGLLGLVPILVGIFVPRTARALRYLRDEVPGIDVPEEVLARMEGTPLERQPEEGVAIAVEIVRQVCELPGIRGVHLMAIRNEEGLHRVIEEAGLLPRPDPAAGP